MPSWVKLDVKRFPRAKVGNPPRTHDLVSLFDDRCVGADSKAFTQLMRHVEKFNKQETTVIMVQVENECGVRDDSRDRSDLANAQFDSPVPTELTSKLRDDWENLNKKMQKTLVLWSAKGFKEGGTWPQVFGDGKEVDELFMAYHYAKYIESVASAGRKETSLPMFTNAWQPSPESGVAGGGDSPGIYPSGGPVPSVIDIYHLFAPTLSFVSPDIYTTEYEQTCLEYSHRQQPLFIPEQRRDEYGAIRIWSAIGTHNALGTSPFGIDTDPSSPFKHHFALLAKVTPAILAARQDGRQVHGFFFDRYPPGSKDPSPTRKVIFGEWILEISRAMVFGHPDPGYGLIIQSSKPSTFILVGEGYQVKFPRHNDDFTSILSFTELDILDGEEKRLRLLNGDETASSTTGTVARMPGLDPDYGDFPVAISIPSRTRIAECVPYSLPK
jgi:hypothetical protein